jgi:AcrR family transcriptional regulator
LNTPDSDPAALAAPRKAGRPTAEDALLLTERIIQVATDAFVADGYAATTVDHIVRLAGISKKTFYARFADKAEVFDAVVTGYTERNIQNSTAEALRSGSLADQLHQLACHLLGWTLTPQVLGIYRVAMAESQRFPELARKVFTSPVAGVGAQVASLLQAHLGDRLDAQQVRLMSLHFLSSAISPPFMRAMQGLEPPELTDAQRRHLRLVIDWFLNGVVPRAPGLTG